MTVAEMNHSFLLKAKVLDRTDIPNPLSFDTIALLNVAQNMVMDELVNAKRFDLLRPVTESVLTAKASFEATYNPGINTDGDSTNVPVGVIKLSSLSTSVMSYRNYVRSQSKVTRTVAPTIASAIFVQNEEIPKELLSDFETSGVNYPIFSNPKCFVEGDYLIVVADYYTDITHILTTVIRYPKGLDLSTANTTLATTSELPTLVHDMIVDKAVQLYNETININDLKRKE